MNTNANQPSTAGRESSGGILRRLAASLKRLAPHPRRSGPVGPTPRARLVTVWDTRLGTFRSVDLRNDWDPLWETARALAARRPEVNQVGRHAGSLIDEHDDTTQPTASGGRVARLRRE
jgi:hypothetical protein